MRSIQSIIEQRAGDFADKAYNALVVTLQYADNKIEFLVSGVEE